MFQNKKLKRNATYAIAEVAKVALCASNCALPTSGNNISSYSYSIPRLRINKQCSPLFNLGFVKFCSKAREHRKAVIKCTIYFKVCAHYSNFK